MITSNTNLGEKTLLGRLEQNLGSLSIATIAVVCFFLSATSFFGIDLYWFVRPSNIPDAEIPDWNIRKQIALLFALVAMLGLYAATTLVSKLNEISANQLKLGGMSDKFVERLRLRLDEQLERVDYDLNPILNKIIGNYAMDLANSLRTAINDRSIVIKDLNEFRVFYRRALKAFPTSNIWATSLASKDYFWSDPSINEAIAEFIDQGGTMKRIFFLSEPADLNNTDVREILNGQRKVGVEVFVVLLGNIPEELRRLFVVDQSQPIAWEVQTVPGAGRIRDITARVDTVHVKEFRDKFERLLLNPVVRKYTPQLSSL